MKKILFICVLVFLFFTAMTQAQTYNSDSTSYPKVSKIEANLYNKTYENDDISSRIDRIEMTIFNQTFPQKSLSARVDSIGDKLDLNGYFNISKSDLSDIEQDVFSRSFPNDDSTKRLERLETKVFGAVQSGNPEKRMKLLARASKNFANNYNYSDDSANVPNQQYSQQNYPTYTSSQSLPRQQNYSQGYQSSSNFPLFSTQYQSENIPSADDFFSDNTSTTTTTGNRCLDFLQSFVLPIVTGLLGNSNYYNNNNPYSYNNNYPYPYPYPQFTPNYYRPYNYPSNYYNANPNYTCSPYYSRTLFNNAGVGVHILD